MRWEGLRLIKCSYFRLKYTLLFKRFSCLILYGGKRWRWLVCGDMKWFLFDAHLKAVHRNSFTCITWSKIETAAQLSINTVDKFAQMIYEWLSCVYTFTICYKVLHWTINRFSMFTHHISVLHVKTYRSTCGKFKPKFSDQKTNSLSFKRKTKCLPNKNTVLRFMIQVILYPFSIGFFARHVFVFISKTLN